MGNASKKDYTMGDIVNLMSVDCQRIQDSFQFQYQLPAFFVLLALAMYLVWRVMRVAMLGALCIIIVLGILQIVLAKLQQVSQIHILAQKSCRIRLLKEVLNGIKVFNIYIHLDTIVSTLP